MVDADFQIQSKDIDAIRRQLLKWKDRILSVDESCCFSADDTEQKLKGMLTWMSNASDVLRCQFHNDTEANQLGKGRLYDAGYLFECPRICGVFRDYSRLGEVLRRAMMVAFNGVLCLQLDEFCAVRKPPAKSVIPRARLSLDVAIELSERELNDDAEQVFPCRVDRLESVVRL